MPWLSIFMAILSFFLTKKKTGSTATALAAGALAGVGTYYVTHETDWGKTNLGSLDNVTAATPLLNADGSPVLDAQGNAITIPAGSTVEKNPDGTVKVVGGVPSVTNGVTDVLKSWGATGTAAVIGTTAVATSDSFSKYLPWILGGAALLLLTR